MYFGNKRTGKVSSRRWANLNQGRNHFPHSFWSSNEYFNHCQSEHCRAHWLVIYIPPIMLIIEPRMVINIWTHNPISFKMQICSVSVLGVAPNHLPLKYICLIKKNNRIGHVYITIVRNYVGHQIDFLWSTSCLVWASNKHDNQHSLCLQGRNFT